MLKAGFFDFLSDETAPGPIDQLCAGVKRVVGTTATTVHNAAQTETGREIGGAVKTGVVIGLGIGATVLVVRAVGAVADIVFGK